MDTQLQYEIHYSSENSYSGALQEAHLQFLIIPETNDTQQIRKAAYYNNLGVHNQFSLNGFGFQTLRLHLRNLTDKVVVKADFQVEKSPVNAFDFDPQLEADKRTLSSPEFLATHGIYLDSGFLTQITGKTPSLFSFIHSHSIFENLKQLNSWCHKFLEYASDKTTTKTTVSDLFKKPQGVCQDYAHLFCALARSSGIPARYVSGYLHQGVGLVGSARLHAWAEALVPGIGWLGFDSTNNLLVNSHYIKICHGRDYSDCAPLKGVVYGIGSNQTDHTVQVSVQQ